MESDGTFDPFDLNKEEFNVSLYMHKLVNTCNLSNMIRREHNVTKEISSLGNEMKALVYDNYNKFLIGTETLTKMKSDIRNMEKDMIQLSSKIAGIGECTRKILSVLERQSSRMSHLLDKHNSLKKLKIIIDFVPTLKFYIESGHYQLSVTYYLKIKQALMAYGQMSSFASITKDAQCLINHLKKLLRGKFKSERSMTCLFESVNLLQKLDEPLQNICEDFLKCSTERLIEEISTLDHHEKYEIRSVEESLRTVEFFSHFIDLLFEETHIFIQIFLQSQTKKYPENSKHILQMLANYICNVKEFFFKNMPKTDLVQNMCNIQSSDFIFTMGFLFQNLQGIYKLLGDADPISAFLEIFSEACHSRCCVVVENYKESFNNILSQLRERFTTQRYNDRKSLNLLEERKDLEASFSHLMKSLSLSIIPLSQLNDNMQQSADFSSRTENFQKLFFKKFVVEEVMISSLKYISRAPLSMIMDAKSKTFPCELLLLLSNFYHKLHEIPLIAMFSNLAGDCIWEIEDINMYQLVLHDECNEIAETILLIYVQKKVEALVKMMQVSMKSKNWKRTTEPRKVRVFIKRIAQELEYINDELKQLYNDLTTFSNQSNQSRILKMNVFGKSIINDILGNMSDPFSERVNPFTKPKFTTSSIMESIVCLFLKDYQEFIRVETFNRHGLQQMQVDLHYLKMKLLSSFVVNERLVASMTDEILQDCIRRCVSPALMDESLVEFICQG